MPVLQCQGGMEMLRKLMLVALFLMVVAGSARAQDKIELFGGYSFEHLGTSPSRNLNGWEVTGQYKLMSWIGAVADVDGHYGRRTGSDTRLLSFMVGPQISMPAHISPFAHALVGVQHAATINASDNSIATAIGGGIDLRLLPFIGVRAIQVDEVFTRLFGGTQHNLRISTGVVIRF